MISDRDSHYLSEDALESTPGSEITREIRTETHLSEEFTQQAIKTEILDLFSVAERFSLQSLSNRFSNIKDTFRLSEEIIQEVGRKAFLDQLKYGDVNSALKIKMICNLSEDFVQPIIQKEFLARVLNGFYATAFSLKTCFNLPIDFLQSSEVQEILQNQFLKIINSNYINNPYPHSQGGGEITSVDDAFQFQTELELSKEFIQNSVQDACLDKIKNGHNYLALEIIKQFKLSIDFLQLPEVKKFIESQSSK